MTARKHLSHQHLKQSEVIPAYKKLDTLQKENYRPVSLLPLKISFQKLHGTQHFENGNKLLIIENLSP